MKSKIKFIISKSYKTILFIFIKIMCINKDKGLLYTDSRSLYMKSFLSYKNPFYGYTKYLLKLRNWNISICPEKHTTLIDFLYYYTKLKIKNDLVIILHIGVVDFSPRTLSDAQMILDYKREKLSFLLGNDIAMNARIGLLNGMYEGQDTATIYDKFILSKLVILLSQIAKSNKIIYVTSNPVLINWRGNYFRDRPKNLNESLESENYLIQNICFQNVLNLKDINHSFIKHITTDNIHLNSNGHLLVGNVLRKFISKC